MKRALIVIAAIAIAFLVAFFLSRKETIEPKGPSESSAKKSEPEPAEPERLEPTRQAKVEPAEPERVEGAGESAQAESTKGPEIKRAPAEQPAPELAKPPMGAAETNGGTPPAPAAPLVVPSKGTKKYVIKMGTLAPTKSTWLDIAHKFGDYVEEQSNNDIKFKWYTGGVMGDEPDMARKLKIGQLQGGGFTGVGLGKITPSVRVLELPLLFENYDEVDHILAKHGKTLEAEFEKEGFVFLGWVEVGFIYIFSKKEIKTLEDTRGLKIWLWQGDPLSQEIFKYIDTVTVVPLPLPEVMTSLQTGLIDTFYGSPLSSVALQWWTQADYMTDMPLVYEPGAMVLSKRAYDKLPPNYQKLIKDAARKFLPQMITATRKDDIVSLQTMKDEGLTVVEPAATTYADFKKKTAPAYESLKGTLYSAELLDEITSSLKAYRANRAASAR